VALDNKRCAKVPIIVALTLSRAKQGWARKLPRSALLCSAQLCSRLNCARIYSIYSTSLWNSDLSHFSWKSWISHFLTDIQEWTRSVLDRFHDSGRQSWAMVTSYRVYRVHQSFRNWDSMVKVDKVCQPLWQYDQSECQILRKNAKSWGSMRKCVKVEKGWVRKYEKVSLKLRKWSKSWEGDLKVKKVWESQQKVEKVCWKLKKCAESWKSMRKSAKSWESVLKSWVSVLKVEKVS